MPERKKTARKTRSVTEVFAERLREARNARRWTQQDLADALAKLGAPMDRTTIAKLEKGQRQVRLDELVAIAAALDVSPLFLFLPLRLEEEVKLAPKLARESFAAIQWARGVGPLNRANDRTYHFQSPGTWVTWKPGESDDPTHGGALSREEAIELATEVEARS